jgi:hypothetical protein
MGVHLLVTQLRFARSEFVRCLEGLTGEEGVRRIGQMNCISWIIDHLANQEQRYWIIFPGGQALVPGLYDLVGSGRPASTPPLDEMWAAWREITTAADATLDTLTPELLEGYYLRDGKLMDENRGTILLRHIYHYWFHTGEAHAIRQNLGHKDLPQFVGDGLSLSPYFPEK